MIVKNLHYPDFDLIKEMPFNKRFEIFSESIKTDNITVFLGMYKQYKKGIQLFIEKNVTDELINTDLKDIRFEEINFPASSVELYFEDRKFPTIIFQNYSGLENPFIYKKDAKNVAKLFNVNVDELEKIAYQMEKSLEKPFKDRCNKIGQNINFIDGAIMIYSAVDESNNECFYRINFLSEEINKWICNGYSINSNLNQYEKEYQKDLYKLCCKVFLYISIPQYKAIPITKKQLKKEGKPCVKNRPNRPISKVIYVPSVINIDKINKSTKNGDMKKPHFRRGHFRMLRNERFKKQGELIFVRPCMIHGGDMKDKLYVARKVKEEN